MKTAGITASKENYLKTILRLKQEKCVVRAIDIATEMNLSRPSVSTALRVLAQEDYIRLDDNRYIDFTPQGLAAALKVQERYDTLYAFLLSLGVSEAVAALDAGRMEHAISDESFSRFKELVAV
ncbi:metal-dependent transcriptional regulator [Sporobacter termitidis]|nr:metal-dependent transcriptional regulator [Sporobacter termitidis]